MTSIKNHGNETADIRKTNLYFIDQLYLFLEKKEIISVFCVTYQADLETRKMSVNMLDTNTMVKPRVP